MNLDFVENLLILIIALAITYYIILYIYNLYYKKDDNVNEELTTNTNLFKKFNGNIKITFPGEYTEITYRYNNISKCAKQICEDLIKPVIHNLNQPSVKYKVIDYMFFNSKKYKDGYISTIYFTINNIGTNETQVINVEVATNTNKFYHINYLINNTHETPKGNTFHKNINDFKETIPPIG